MHTCVLCCDQSSILIVKMAETALPSTWLIRVCFFFYSLKSFNVDLISGKSKDIALHLNPRLNIKAFVRNSFLHESWGEEERNITSFPFSPGMYFEMIIYCDVREFKVAVNGVHSLEYKHRFKELSNIDTLEIDGDIHLLEVRSW